MMSRSDSPTIVFRYQRVVAWISLCAMFGVMGLFAAFVPDLGDDWAPSHAHNIKQVFIMAIPLWLLRPLLVLMGLVFLGSGAWTAVATAKRLPIVTVTDDWIEARTVFGRRRRLAWSEITDAMTFKSQIVLATGESGFDAQARVGMRYNDSMVTWEWLMFQLGGAGFWKRNAVCIETNMIDAERGSVQDLIARYKPNLIIRTVRFM